MVWTPGLLNYCTILLRTDGRKESSLPHAAAAGDAKSEEIDRDGEAEQKAADSMETIPLQLAGGVSEKPQQQANDQRNVGDGHETAGFSVELSIGDAHGRNSFRD
jgi:hypothetical protein